MAATSFPETGQSHVLTAEAWVDFCHQLQKRTEFAYVLQLDFLEATQAADGAGFAAMESRAMVRAFGSLIDGLSRAMHEIAVSTEQLFGQPFNRFLKDKAADRAL